MGDREERDPFREARQKSGALRFDLDDERFLMLLRQADIKAVAGDFKRFSSDAPFRVPIPSEESVRSVRQLPIESDPPEHSHYRKLIMPVFTRPNDPVMAADVRDMVDQTVDECIQAGAAEIVTEFALPLQSRALTLLLNVPQEHAETWISWGTHVFRDDDELSPGKGSLLDEYIDRELDRAYRKPGADFFSLLTRARLHGQPLGRDEMRGFANLVFAGGRDTVINLITNSLAWLAENPDQHARLRAEPGLISRATEEFVRFFSPLPHIGRVVTEDTELLGERVPAGSRLSLCWASANRDESVFNDADVVNIDRHPNPHMGFGKGHHTCLGASHARLVLRSILKIIAARIERLTVQSREPSLDRFGDIERLAGYRKLLLTFKPL